MGNEAANAGRRAAYPAYKSSNVAWLGDVPAHWEVRRLKYTADLINVKVDGANNDLTYTGLEHIECWTGKRIAPNGETTSDGQASLYRRGDVLFGKLPRRLALGSLPQAGFARTTPTSHRKSRNTSSPTSASCQVRR